MALGDPYMTGTVSVTAGNPNVTGVGTAWLTSGKRVNDFFWYGGLDVRIASINSDTSITLVSGWPGATLVTATGYELREMTDAARLSQTASAIYSSLASGNLASLASGTISGLTSFGIRSTAASFDVKLASSEAITADRTLSLVLGNANRTLSMAGNFTTAGAFPLTLTVTGATNVTLPTSGTLATTGANAFTGAQSISVGGNVNQLRITSTNNGTQGVQLFCQHSRSGGGVASNATDALLLISASGVNSALAERTYGYLICRVADSTVGADSSYWDFATVTNGAQGARIRIGPLGGVFHPSVSGGEKGNNTINYGGVYQNGVPVATTGANTFTAAQAINISTAAGGNLSLQNSDPGILGATMQFYHNSASAAVNDQLAYIAALGNNSAAGFATYATLSVLAESVTASAESARWRFAARQAGTTTYRMEIGNGVIVGAPTGSFLGAGTINAVGVYDDNTPLTCMAAAEDYLSRNVVDLDIWDNLFPDIVEPETVEKVPVMEEVEEEVPVDEPIKAGKGRGNIRRHMERRMVKRQKVRIVKVLDEEGNEIGWKEEPLFEEVRRPARVVKRQHRTARIFKQMLDSGFDPKNPDQYFSRYAADQALPGMPTRGDGPLKWEHNALSIGEQHSQLVLASELQTNVMRSMWERIKDQEVLLTEMAGALSDLEARL